MSDHNIIDPNIIIPFHKISKSLVILPHFSINLHCIFTLISILFKRKGPTLNIYISCNAKKLPVNFLSLISPKNIFLTEITVSSG